MNNFDNIATLISTLETNLGHKTYAAIGVDGATGSGKTFLASEIGKKLNISCFSIDDFLIKNQKAYLKYIRYNDRKDAMQAASKSYILEGVFLLEVASTIKAEITDLIYVKRFSKSKFWYDERICNPPDSSSFEEYRNEINQECQEAFGTPCDSFSEHLLRYHFEFKPHRIAKYVYERID